MRALLLLAALASADGDVEGVIDGWVWPVPIHADGRKAKISSGREMRAGPDGKMDTADDYLHRGVDIMFRRPECGKQKLPYQSKCYEIDPDWPALAASAGEVVYAKKTKTGISIIIKHDRRVSTAYHHLNMAFVKEGEKVTAGQPIGYISYNPDGYKLARLHFDYILDKDFVDPAPHMKPWQHVKRPIVPGTSAMDLPVIDDSISGE